MDIICELNKVDFFESSKEYPKFKDSKIEHGFELEIPDKFDVHHVRQVHGNNIIELHKILPGKSIIDVEADGIYSNIPGQRVGVKTADCLPVLFQSSSATPKNWGAP